MNSIATGLLAALLVIAANLHNFECAQHALDLSANCERAQSTRSEKDGYFHLMLRNSRRRMLYRFRPGQLVTIILSNHMFGVAMENYQIVAVTEGANHTGAAERAASQGQFLSAISQQCPHIAVASKKRRGQFNRIKIKWKAPEMPMKCVEIRASVIKSSDNPAIVYRDSGHLTVKLCPTEMNRPLLEAHLKNRHRQSSYGAAGTGKTMERVMMPPRMEECCACGVATYRFTFKSLFTNYNHPTDYPVGAAGLHWTNMFGASHDENFLIYYEGGLASVGVQALCSYGSPAPLKQQFALHTTLHHLRDLIDAPGIWDSRLMSRTEVERSTVFSVNRTHHLFSFLTMLGPSTDWCAGVSAQDLCQRDCSWRPRLQLDLYPWDGGYRKGNTYLPKNSDRLYVQEPIRKIDRSWMKDAPFTPNKPVARITLEKISPKNEWECADKPGPGTKSMRKALAKKTSNGAPGASIIRKKKRAGTAGSIASPLDDPTLFAMSRFLCKMSEWSNWTPCSKTCGVGSRRRSRKMIINKKNELCRHLSLFETQHCEGPKRYCDFSRKCSMVPWSRWSTCTADCTRKVGVQMRTRWFVRSHERKECPVHKLEERRSCSVKKENCDPITICGSGRVDGTSGCKKKKKRYYYSAAKHACVPFVYQGCKGGLNRFRTRRDCKTMCLAAVSKLAPWRRQKMVLLQAQTSALVVKKRGKRSRKARTEMAASCYAPKNYGRACNETDNVANKKYTRWHFTLRNGRCRSFGYLGCGGNTNNFVTYKSCAKSCMISQRRLLAWIEHAKETDGGGGGGAAAGNTLKIRQDCQVSGWSAWGPCSVPPCSSRSSSDSDEVHRSRRTEGEQFRQRLVTRPPMNGGMPCKPLYEKRVCSGCL